MTSPDFKDIVHTQAQWKVIEEKLRERDAFEKAKSIIVREHLQLGYNGNYPYEKDRSYTYECLSEQEETQKIAHLENELKKSYERNNLLQKELKDYQTYNPPIKSKSKRRWGFLWKI